jgi:sugar phosphate isomerase/epimerase
MPTMTNTPRAFFTEGGPKIGLQLYTLGDDVTADVAATLARVAAIGYREIQLPQLYGKTPRELRGWADAAGVQITSLHLPGMARGPGLNLTSDAAAIADAMGTLGAREVAMPIMLFPTNFSPRTGEGMRDTIVRAVAESGAALWQRTAAFLNERGAALARHGIRLSYHNHNLEFAPIGQTSGWDILARETDPALVSFEIDVGWVATGGRDPTTFLQALHGRISQLHVKDFGLSMSPATVGQGTQNWASILPAARAAGCQHFYVEQEPPFSIPRMTAVEQSFAYLAALRV